MIILAAIPAALAAIRKALIEGDVKCDPIKLVDGSYEFRTRELNIKDPFSPKLKATFNSLAKDAGCKIEVVEKNGRKWSVGYPVRHLLLRCGWKRTRTNCYSLARRLSLLL